MGSCDSKCAQLLEQMGWQGPELAEEFYHDSLVSYLQVQQLEVVLPKHAPQADLSIPDRKPSMYPRPNFCWEAYKMHLALIGPSTACKKQFVDFLPKVVSLFKGAPARLAPGREAVPHYFFDQDLHRMVLWELPEIAFKQGCEDYIRELGLLYIDCVFMLFSDKYLLTDIYAKLCVAMAIHGIPFFVICTQSSDNVDEKMMEKIKCDFQKKDIMVRILNPQNPGKMLEELISDFFKEVSWNRSAKDVERTSDISDSVLGQTVRLKGLEKKPELNGRCGVCVGFDKEQARYHIRLITNGIESDVALKQTSFSVLKPKLLDSMVRIKDLESKPELNGRFGFVDAFLRETERYMVLIPDKPGTGLALALKSANLEKVETTHGQPVKSQPKPVEAKAKAASAPVATATPSSPTKPGGAPRAAGPSTGYPTAAQAKAPSAAGASRGPPAPAPATAVPPAAAPAATGGISPVDWAGPPPQASQPTAAAPASAPEEKEEEEEEVSEAEPEEERDGGPQLQLSQRGLLAMRVWALVVGDPDDAEEIIDHLMDCGKTVFTVSPSGGHFNSTAELNSNPNLPNAEVLAFIESSTEVEDAVGDAARLGLKGILFHPGTNAYGSSTVARCRGAGLAVHGADILEKVEPGTGIPVAPLD